MSAPKLRREDLGNFALPAALIVLVLLVAYCHDQSLPKVPEDPGPSLGAFFEAQAAAGQAQRICRACEAEMADAGSLELVPDCLLRCMDATAEAVEAADRFAETLR